MPERVKITGDLYHRQVPNGAVSVAWPTRYHNAHRAVRPRERAVELYREHLARNPELVERARRELAGKDLACWCPIGQPCHADVALGGVEVVWAELGLVDLEGAVVESLGLVVFGMAPEVATSRVEEYSRTARISAQRTGVAGRD
jgi:Domain of unknown function (DUF4326)